MSLFRQVFLSSRRDDGLAALGCFMQSIVLCLVASGASSAQTAPSGVITGHLASTPGASLAGVKISLMPSGGGVPIASAITDATGEYRLPPVSYGDYLLHIALTSSVDQAVQLHTPGIVQDLRAPAPGAAFGLPLKSSNGKPEGPLFRASGVQGTIAPSGYSGGASDEDAEQLHTVTTSIGIDLMLLIGRPVPTCNQQLQLLAEVALHPDRFEAQRDIGLSALAHGDATQASRSLEAAKRMRPGDVVTNSALAATYLRLGRYAEARVLLDPLLVRELADAPILLLSGELYSAQGASDQARSEFFKAAKTSTLPTIAYAAGVGLLQLDLAADAQTLFRQALERWPENSSLEAGLGMAMASSREKNAAAEKLLKVVRNDPDITEVYPVLARLTGTTPELDRQITDTVHAYGAAHPNESEAHYDLAVVLWRTSRTKAGSRDQIRAELERSLVLDPGRSDAHLLLGVVDEEDGYKMEAARELEASLKLTPGSAQAHYRLALIERDLGRSAESHQEMKRFLALRSEREAMDGVTPIAGRIVPTSRLDRGTRTCPAEEHP